MTAALPTSLPLSALENAAEFLPRHIGDGFAARGLMRALRPDIYAFDSQHFAALRRSEANSALLRAFVPELKRQARAAPAAALA